jgi:hypothetical protein
MKVVDALNTEKLNKALQIQRDEMNVEFEKKIQNQWDTHDRELEFERQRLKKYLEENRASTFTVEIVKAQALEINEKLESEQKEFLNLLSNIQVDRDDQLRL